MTNRPRAPASSVQAAPRAASAPERMAIAVCTYNRGERIRETLESIAAVDRCDGRVSRILVIDNNCTDSTPAVVDAFAARCKSIDVRRVRETTQGLTAARQRAIAESVEPILAFVDDDCLLDPDWARAILARFDADRRAGIVGGHIGLKFEHPIQRRAERFSRYLAGQDLAKSATRLLDPESIVVGATMAIRRDALRQSGWIDAPRMSGRTGAALSSGEDAEICIRIRQAGWNVWYDPAAHATHLIPHARQSPDYLRRLLAGIAASEPSIKWLAHGQPGPDWAESHLRKSRAHLLKTLFTDWRPWSRPYRLAERRARLAAWQALLNSLRDPARTNDHAASTP